MGLKLLLPFVLLMPLIYFCARLPFISGQSTSFQVESPWIWVCNEQKQCIKSPTGTTDKDLLGKSHASCKLTCYDSSVIWPKPSIDPVLSKELVSFRADRVNITRIASPTSQTESLLIEAGNIYLNLIRQMEWTTGSSGQHQINIEIAVTQDDIHMTMSTDESYSLSLATTGSITTVYIVAPTFFGARHAMETLTHLMAWDDLVHSLVLIRDATINDRPAFPHRGLSIDTVRNYQDLDLLKRIIDGMSYDKLNAFHWHITDSQAFPFVSSREPLLAVYGAYSPSKVYTPQAIQELVRYAQVRGVKIIPEMDGPSHVASGWEWGPTYGKGDLVLCYVRHTFPDWCTGPPCGILNPVNNHTYSVLGNIYRDMADLFQSDVFHMGGDEVKSICWNQTEEVLQFMSEQGWGREKEDFLRMWSYFQNTSLAQLDAAFGKEQDVILWTSSLTDAGRASLFLDPKRYIVQFWENGNDTNLKPLIQQGYRLIMSNADALYLDCGYSAWIGDGLNNWCSPYKGWQLIYENSPRKIVENYGLDYADHAQQFLGGEAALWSEQTQGKVMESKLWPRASALAERLWSDPTTGWKDAEPRLRSHRDRMLARGIGADSIQPEYCDQNDSGCI